ncbi:hypothetical protein [Actinocorallia longicatena]
MTEHSGDHSVRRDFAVFSSEITSRVFGSLVLSRFLIRSTPCVTRMVPASQASVSPAQAEDLPTTHPVGEDGLLSVWA